jgi:hypothetical protein
MANDRQFKVDTRFVATRGVSEYRASVSRVVGPDDLVLELGCEPWRDSGTGPDERNAGVGTTRLS